MTQPSDPGADPWSWNDPAPTDPTTADSPPSSESAPTQPSTSESFAPESVGFEQSVPAPAAPEVTITDAAAINNSTSGEPRATDPFASIPPRAGADQDFDRTTIFQRMPPPPEAPEPTIQPPSQPAWGQPATPEPTIQPPSQPAWGQPAASEPVIQPPSQPAWGQPATPEPAIQPPNQINTGQPSWGQPAAPAYGQPAYGAPNQPSYPESPQQPYGQPPAYAPGSAGGHFQQPPTAYALGSGGGPGANNKRNKIIGAIIAAVVVIAIIVGAIALFGGGKKNNAADNLTSANASQPVFPSTTAAPTAAPTTEAPTETPTQAPTTQAPAGPSADQTNIATVATRFYHAVAAGDNATFCPLLDPANLAKLLKTKNIPSCSSIKYTGTDTAKYAAFAVAAPETIVISGDQATIPQNAFTPSGLLPPTLQHEANGTWRLHIYA